MTDQQVSAYVLNAYRILMTQKNLPLILDHFKARPSGGFIVSFTDTKLLDKVSGELGEFDVTIFADTYENMHTTGLDLLAKIKSDASDETRIILRIAYLIMVGYTSNIIEVFKKSDDSKGAIVNYTNAMKWYKELN